MTLAHVSDATRLVEVVGRIDAGGQVLLDRLLQLDDVAAAWTHLAAGRARDKVLLLADRMPQPRR